MPRPGRRVAALGLVVAVGYAAVYVATLWLSDDHQRPLFDGFAPSTPYRWVDPPEEFEDGNVKPEPSTTDLPIDAEGVEVGSAASADGQLVVNLPDGAVPPREGDSSLRVVITPLAPAMLGSPPQGLFADGNAYRVELSYQPSGQAVETLAKPGNVIVTVPVPAVTLLDSADGRSWQRVEGSTHQEGAGLASPVSRVGYFLAAADTPIDFSGGDSGTSRVWLVAVLVVLLAGGLVLGPLLVRRSRRRRDQRKALDRRRAGTTRKPERPRPQARPPAKKKKKKKKKR